MLLGAIPFERSLIYGAELGLFVLGLLMVLAGRFLSRRMFRPGLVLMLLAGGLIASELYRDAIMEWNPMIRADAPILGTWSDGRETVTLHANHQFDFHSPNERFSGEWSRFDWNLRLKAEGIDSEMRFVMYGNELYLMPRPPDDPDDWDGNLGLERATQDQSRL